MGLFSTGRVEATIENSIQNKEEFEQLMIADEIANLDAEQLREFCSPGGLGETLVTEGKLKNRTLVRLSKKDDLARRKKMACYQLAKEANSPAWKKFEFHRSEALKYEKQMFKQYGSKAERLAKEAQRDYLKGDKNKEGLLAKFGAEDR